MKNLNSFLNPKRKENIKFVLSDSFIDEDGKPIEWEFRQLSFAETMEMSKNYANSDSSGEIVAATIAHALVIPDLKDEQLLNALSEREGKNIRKPIDALKVIVNDPEYAKLASVYFAFNDLDKSLGDKIEQAKN